MKRVINGKTYSKTIGVKKGELAAFGDNGELNGSGVKASDIPSFPEAGNVGDVLTKTADGQEWSTPSGGGSMSYSDITLSNPGAAAESVHAVPFTPPSEMVGKKIVSCVNLTSNPSNVYITAISRFSDPVQANNSIYILIDNQSTQNVSSIKFRVFYI